MSKYKYFVAPFQGKLNAGSNVQEVAKQLSDLINHHASQGWEFVEVAEVSIEVQPGCLEGIFGGKVSHVTHNQVVFRHPVT